MSGDPFYPQVITQQKSAGTLFNSYTTAKTVLNATELVTIPANQLRAGRKLRITVVGTISNVVTAQPTFTFQVMMGTTVVWSSGAIQTNASANSELPFRLEIDLRMVSDGPGTSATFLGVGRFTCAAMASGSTAIVVPTTTPAAGNGFDSTIGNVLDHWVGISASNASNAVRVQDYTVELLY
jgi:hypothetical protein